MSSFSTSPGSNAGAAFASLTFSPRSWMLPCSTSLRASPRDFAGEASVFKAIAGTEAPFAGMSYDSIGMFGQESKG